MLCRNRIFVCFCTSIVFAFYVAPSTKRYVFVLCFSAVFFLFPVGGQRGEAESGKWRENARVVVCILSICVIESIFFYGRDTRRELESSRTFDERRFFTEFCLREYSRLLVQVYAGCLLGYGIVPIRLSLSAVKP